MIDIGYFRAHFKIYLPGERRHEQFCEDIPATGESLFVMEYQDPGLGEVPIDFRIIRNVTGMGRFTKWEDVTAIDDLDGATVFYQPPDVMPDVLTFLHRFDEPGEYVGVVTAVAPGGALYTAVFPFEVGFSGFGLWPWLAGLALLLQLHFWHAGGQLSRWKKRLIRSPAVKGEE